MLPPLPDFVIRVGDTGPRIVATITDGDGNAVNVASATPTLAIHGLTVAYDASKEGRVLGDGTDGKVYYDWLADDFTEPGWYSLVWSIELDNGQIQSAPNQDGDTTQLLRVSAAA